MQAQPVQRRFRPVPVSLALTTLTLTLLFLSLLVPLGAAAAEEKDDPQRIVRRAEPATVQIVAAETPPAGDSGVDTIGDEAAHPEPECPPGFVLAAPPLNPALGCIANTIAADSGDSAVVVVPGSDTADNPDPFCPPGFEPALPPLNPALGCVGSGLTLTTGEGESPVVVATLDESAPPGHGCPDGWVPALPPINPALRCINNTAGTGTPASGGTAQYVYVGSSSLEHPGHCAEGYSYRLVLRQNADGSLTWLYTCIPDGTGPAGPDDITSGDGGRRGAMEVSGLKFEVDVIE